MGMGDFDHPQSPPWILSDYIEKIRQRLHVPRPCAENKSQCPGDILITLVIEAIFLSSPIPEGSLSGSDNLALGETHQLLK
jgi:hypothetical protein